MEGKKRKIRTKKGVFFVIPVVLIIIIAIFLAVIFGYLGWSIFSWYRSQGDPSPTINCADWANAPAGYQQKITAAANKAGIQPALLGAIYLSEHSDAWYQPSGGNWTSSVDGDQGPFQIPPTTEERKNYAKFLKDVGFDVSTVGRTDWWNDFDTAAYAAAVDMKNGFKRANKPTNSSDEQAIVFAGLWYNTGPAAAMEWANAGYNLDVPPPSKPDWGNPTAQKYAKRTWENFKKLNLDCKGYTPSAGAGFIAACQGDSTGSGGNVIVIDPGHGTANNNRHDSGEEDVTLEVGKAVRDLLKNKGYTVYMTHENLRDQLPGATNEYTDNVARATIANSKNPAIVLRIHADDGANPKFFMEYPQAGRPDSQNNVGPSADIAAKSQDYTKKIAAYLESPSVGISGKPEAAVTEAQGSSLKNNGNLVMSTHSTVPLALIEMFGMGAKLPSGSKLATDSLYKTKMENGLADALMSIIPLGSSTQVQTASAMTPGCKIAGLALETAMDVKAKECPEGTGCRENSAKYFASIKAGKISAYTTYLRGDGISTWGDWPDITGFSDCARFVGYAVRKSGADTSFPKGGSGDQHDYAANHPDKYEVKPYHSISELQPGDIIWRPYHIEIYIGDNKTFPGFSAASASLGHHGPEMLEKVDSNMPTRIRILK